MRKDFISGLFWYSRHPTGSPWIPYALNKLNSEPPSWVFMEHVSDMGFYRGISVANIKASTDFQVTPTLFLPCGVTSIYGPTGKLPMDPSLYPSEAHLPTYRAPRPWDFASQSSPYLRHCFCIAGVAVLLQLRNEADKLRTNEAPIRRLCRHAVVLYKSNFSCFRYLAKNEVVRSFVIRTNSYKWHKSND